MATMPVPFVACSLADMQEGPENVIKQLIGADADSQHLLLHSCKTHAQFFSCIAFRL